MKGFWLLLLSLIVLASCATAHPDEYLYFPALAKRVLAGDPQAFREVLSQADTTPPGEQLEELAELSSRYVRLAPVEFLRGQASGSTCFGVAFMGPKYVDNPGAVLRERNLRREALESVSDPALELVKQRCLAELAGS
jgi:hypothetical protein